MKTEQKAGRSGYWPGWLSASYQTAINGFCIIRVAEPPRIQECDLGIRPLTMGPRRVRAQ
jgi:hypothetical protein